MFNMFTDESKEPLLNPSHDLSESNIEKALEVLHALFAKNFIKDMIEHAKYIETAKEFLKTIRDPYAFIKLRIRNEVGLGEDYIALNNALIVLREAQTYMKNLPYFSKDPIKKKYNKIINQNLKYISPHVEFITKVVEFHLANIKDKEAMKNKNPYKLPPEMLAKFPRIW